MNIYIYSDESGVFDVAHNKFYVYGGIIFLDKESKDIASRKYLAVEKTVRTIEQKSQYTEIKANNVSNKSKGKLYNSIKNNLLFGTVINQEQLQKEIFNTKRSKQRYLDYAFKICIKRKFEQMIKSGQIDPLKVENLYFYLDEHTTATDGLYELRESMLNEFKYGMFNADFTSFKEPIFKNLKTLEVKYCNSAKNTLIRAADVVANKLFYSANNALIKNFDDNFFILSLPKEQLRK